MCMLCVGEERCEELMHPKFRRANNRATCYGKTVGILLGLHLLFGLSRCLYFSFSAALSDALLVCFGFYIFRRFFRASSDPLPSPMCLSCESQQNLMCWAGFLALSFGLSIWSLVELADSKPTIPQPVGLPQFDYRTLSLWQWKAGLVIAAAIVALFLLELVFSWLLYRELAAAALDERYDQAFQLYDDPEQQRLISEDITSGRAASGGGSVYNARAGTAPADPSARASPVNSAPPVQATSRLSTKEAGQVLGGEHPEGKDSDARSRAAMAAMKRSQARK